MISATSACSPVSAVLLACELLLFRMAATLFDTGRALASP